MIAGAFEEFDALPLVQKKRVAEHYAICVEILGSGHRGAHQRIKDLSREYSGRPGFGIPTLHREYKKWCTAHYDWRVLVDRRAHKSDKHPPQKFLDYWHALQIEHAGNMKAAHRELLRRWQDDVEIPAFGSRSQWSETNGDPMHSGLSYTNLARHPAPPLAEREKLFAALLLKFQELRSALKGI